MLVDNLISMNLLNSRMDINIDNNVLTIKNVTSTEVELKGANKKITIVGDISPDKNGVYKKRVIVVENKEDKSFIKYLCDYTDNFFLSSDENIFTVKVINLDKNPSYFNRID